QQLPAAIDAGVFHNDVIAVAHRHVLLCHEHAYVDQARVLASLQHMLGPLEIIVVPECDVTLDEAVETYLFNSQILSRADGRMTMIAPAECIEHPRVRAFLQSMLQRQSSINEIIALDLHQSMRNGGGPACLRLRVPLEASERAAMQGRVMLDDTALDAL